MTRDDTTGSTPTSIAICTRGRGESLHDTVASALDEGSEAQVVVVDQNDDDRVSRILGPLLDHPRLTVVDTDTIGAGRARNIALATLTTDVICFTDDDCVLQPGFARTLTDTILADPDLALIYAQVTEPDSTRELSGYTPVHVRESASRTTSWDRSARFDRLGLGAGMAARRSDLVDIGGFDPMMGPGGTFPSADDREIALRFLLRGRHLMHLPTAEVVHHGHRAGGAEARALTQRDHIAIGAMYAKFLKTTPRRAILPTLDALGATVTDAISASIRLRRPAGLGKVRYTLVGLWRGLRHPVETPSITYVDTVAGGSSATASD